MKKIGLFIVFYIVGCFGLGKIEFVWVFVENFVKNEEERYMFFLGNFLYGILNGLLVDSFFFDVKRFVIFVGCLESNWILKVGEGVYFNSLFKEE